MGALALCGSAALGIVMLAASGAATFTMSAEAESGQPAGRAASLQATGASGDRLVRFGASGTSTGTLPFAAGSYLNKPLSAATPLDPRSADVVADLAGQARQRGSGINMDRWTTPVYTVGSQTQVRRVYMDGATQMLQNALYEVPLPAGAMPDQEADAHLVVWQPSTDTMWEFWGFSYRADGRPQALYGGRMQQVSSNPGHFIDDDDRQSKWWGATATSIPLLAGLIRTDEVASLHIPHALALAVPEQSCEIRSPAQRTDDPCEPGSQIPAGARFRLPASTDIDALQLPPLGKAIARAARDYGIVVRDRAGAVVFYAEHNTTAYQDIDADISGFPWDKLQMLPPL